MTGGISENLRVFTRFLLRINRDDETKRKVPFLKAIVTGTYSILPRQHFAATTETSRYVHGTMSCTSCIRDTYTHPPQKNCRHRSVKRSAGTFQILPNTCKNLPTAPIYVVHIHKCRAHSRVAIIQSTFLSVYNNYG